MGQESTVRPARLTQRWARTAELVRVLAPRELRLRYRHSVLDIAWAVLTPVVLLLVYGFILTRSFDVTAACGSYFSSAWLGLVTWTFFATAVGGASTSLLTAADLVAKVYFPREVMPLAVAVAAIADLAVGLVTSIGLLLVLGSPLTGAAIGAVLPLAVIVVWAMAIGVFTGVATVFVRDVAHGVRLALTAGFFATPVVYEVAQLPQALAWTRSWNPAAVAITGLRSALLCGTAPDVGLTLAHLGVGLALLVGATLYTRSIEPRLADAL